MFYKIIQPSKVLQAFVKHYWILDEKKVSEKPCKQRIFPSGFTELIFYYGDRYLNIDKNNKSVVQPFLHFTGQRNDYYDVSPTGKVGLIAITFKPDAAKMFFKIPVSEIENSSIALADFLGNRIKNLEYELQILTDNHQRIQLIDKFLITQLEDSLIHDYKRINFSLNKINQSKGVVSVESLADSACLSTKQFNRKFREFIGTNPKQFIRVVRFQNAIYNKQNNSTKNLTELAYKCGYYDQAHFTNEFKSFTGYSPKDFFKICEPFSDYFS